MARLNIGRMLRRRANRNDPAVVLDRKIALSRLALAWERIWPALWPPMAVVGLVLFTALIGLWGMAPAWLHYAGVAAALIAFGAALTPLARIRWPTRDEARSRLDQSSASRHRPATGFEDRLAGEPGEPTFALWQEHKRRLAAEAARLSVRAPSPRLLTRDPFALRAALAVALVAAFAYAGPDWRGRIAETLVPDQAGPTDPLRLDAWITPPAYTGRPPVFLADGSEPLAAIRVPAAPIPVPAGSELVLRFHGQSASEASLAPEGADAMAFAYTGDPESGEFKSTLERGATLTVARPGSDGDLTWTFAVVADAPPQIALAQDISTTDDQALRLVYSVKDDYGVVAADARFTYAANSPESAEVAPPSAPHLQIEPPDFALVLPGIRVREATKEMFRDLTAHPWAGIDVEIVLAARDEAGQEGTSVPVRLTLPERRFVNPMARAVIEQRRDLVRLPHTHERVARALNALTIAPERFIEDTTVFLALRTAYLRTRDIGTNEELRGSVDLLWDIALGIEDGDLSLAERELRAAQEELARALAEGASDEEIERLMSELREALSRFMQAMREQARRIGDLPQMDGRMLESRDLSTMMDMIEQLAKSGSRDAAQQLLSQLQNLLENLQGMAGMQMSPEQSMMSDSLDELGRMIGEQQRLMDETYRQGQQEGQGGEQSGRMPLPGQQGEQGEFGGGGQSQRGQTPGEGQSGQMGQPNDGMGNAPGQSLADQQQALREQLQALADQLVQGGVDAPSQLDRAGREMGEAETDLRDEDNSGAVGNQREALDQLRQGAQSMAQQLAEGMNPGAGPGQPGPSSRNGLTDPLGRPMRSTGPEFGLTVKVPDEIDAETARRLREELQRRLGDTFRRALELDYIERLLELF